MKIGSLCTGYGGLDMAVESFFNAETAWTCEYDKYASQVIAQRLNKPNHGDLKTTDWTQVEPIDILTAGYPCQPFSTAGLRKGADDERHLWPHIKNIIGILRPQFIVLENVRGHFGLGFREVLGDLAACGYDATWKIVRASDVGAPHRRERLFVLAYAQSGWSGRQSVEISGQVSESGRDFEIAANTDSDARTQSRRADRELRAEGAGLRTRQDKGKTGQKYWGGGEIVSDSSNQCVSSIENVSQLGRKFTARSDMHLQEVPDTLVDDKLNAKFVEYMMGLPNGWVTDVEISRSQQLKILGNGVVPQQAEYALELLWEQACG